VNFNAPTSGTYGNIIFFEDRRKGSDSVQNTFSGGSSVTLTGVIYCRNSQVIYTGGSSTTSLRLGIVADEVVFSGNTNLQGGISGNGKGTEAKLALIE
jgi:hypothetical protein